MSDGETPPSDYNLKMEKLLNDRCPEPVPILVLEPEPELAIQQASPPAATSPATPPAPIPQLKALEIQPKATISTPRVADPTLQEPIPESLDTDDIVSLD